MSTLDTSLSNFNGKIKSKTKKSNRKLITQRTKDKVQTFINVDGIHTLLRSEDYLGGILHLHNLIIWLISFTSLTITATIWVLVFLQQYVVQTSEKIGGLLSAIESSRVKEGKGQKIGNYRKGGRIENRKLYCLQTYKWAYNVNYLIFNVYKFCKVGV